MKKQTDLQLSDQWTQIFKQVFKHRENTNRIIKGKYTKEDVKGIV